jgi:hypothetical protein
VQGLGLSIDAPCDTGGYASPHTTTTTTTTTARSNEVPSTTATTTTTTSLGALHDADHEDDYDVDDYDIELASDDDDVDLLGDGGGGGGDGHEALGGERRRSRSSGRISSTSDEDDGDTAASAERDLLKEEEAYEPQMLGSALLPLLDFFFASIKLGNPVIDQALAECQLVPRLLMLFERVRSQSCLTIIITHLCPLSLSRSLPLPLLFIAFVFLVFSLLCYFVCLRALSSRLCLVILCLLTAAVLFSPYGAFSY